MKLERRNYGQDSDSEWTRIYSLFGLPCSWPHIWGLQCHPQRLKHSLERSRQNMVFHFLILKREKRKENEKITLFYSSQLRFFVLLSRDCIFHRHTAYERSSWRMSVTLFIAFIHIQYKSELQSTIASFQCQWIKLLPQSCGFLGTSVFCYFFMFESQVHSNFLVRRESKIYLLLKIENMFVNMFTIVRRK